VSWKWDGRHGPPRRGEESRRLLGFRKGVNVGGASPGRIKPMRVKPHTRRGQSAARWALPGPTLAEL